MLTLIFLAGVLLAVGFAVGVLALLLKLVLLPLKLAFGLAKLAVVCTVGLLLLMLGLPLLLVLGFPLLVLGVFVWGVAKLAFA